MTLTKWNPWREMEAMERDMSRLFSRMTGTNFDRLFNDRWLDPMRFDGGGQNGQQHWTLATDVIETDHALKLRAALPGVDPKDVNIQIEDGVLTISAERRFEDKQEDNKYSWIEQQYGLFSRSISLPKYVDVDAIEANYNHGMLELTIPKVESAKPRRIELTIGEKSSGRSLQSEENSTPAIEAGEGSGQTAATAEEPVAAS